jgi:aldose 1-epimerase
MTSPVPDADEQRFDLRAGALHLALRPDLGGSIAGLWHRDTPILRSADPTTLREVTAAACFPLLPYAHRLGLRRFRFRGREHSTAANVAGEAHSMHGVGWQRRWTIVSHTAQDAVLQLRHAPDADWPYAFEALQHVNLTPNALGLQLVFTNTDAAVQPVGLGWWASFPKRARSRLHAEVAQRWEEDPGHLPIVRHAQPGLDAALDYLDFDNAFEGFSGPARLRDERFSLQLRASTGYLVLRSRPAQDHYALSPCSHVPNALHMADPAAHGLRAVAPGESTELAMSLDVSVL